MIYELEDGVIKKLNTDNVQTISLDTIYQKLLLMIPSL